MAGDKFAGIHIKWDYANHRCRISMPGYIENLLIKFKHPHPHKPRLSSKRAAPATMPTSVPEGTWGAKKGGKQNLGSLLVTYY